MGKFNHFLVVSAFLLVGSCFAAENVGGTSAERSRNGKVVVIPVKGMIAGDMGKMFEREIDRANKDGAKMIVLEIDTPGGMVDVVEEICGKLLQTKIPTVALVTTQAISGGSMIATACDKIVMLKGSTIGDCEPHSMIGSLPENMREKIETKIRADMRANAQANGYPDKLLEAMVTKAFELYEIKFADGKSELLYKNEIKLIESQIKNKELKRKITERKLIVKEGSLLTLTADEALKLKLANSVVDNSAGFYLANKIKNTEIIRVKVKPFKLEMNIQLEMILVAFLIIGIAGIIVESQVPGFGVPGIIGLIGFAGFFSVLLFNGKAEEWEIALFVIGIVFLLIELFIIPGFGIAGILGIGCVIAAIVFSIIPPLDSVQNWQVEMGNVVSIIGVSMLGAIVLGAVVIKYLPKISFFKGLVLTAKSKSGEEILAEVEESEKGKFPHEDEDNMKNSLIGEIGLTITMLRPSGKIKIKNEKVLDVVSDGIIIEEGKKVKIVDINGPRIEVVEFSDI